MSINIHYSNHTEPLASQFAKTQLDESNIFSPPMVIVPNPHLKKWLQLFTAKTNGICSNLNFYFLEEGLLEILQEVIDSNKKFELLNSSKLSLYIYHLLTNQDKHGITLFQNFLNKTAPNFHRKAWQLSTVLSKNILEYELSREEIIDSWNNNKLYYNTEIESFQFEIYKKIFSKNGIRDQINSGHMTLPQLYYNYKKLIKKNNDSKIYIFGLSQITPFHTKVIYELGQLVNFEIFQLNPCSEFWEDVSTPAEDRWAKIKDINITSKKDGLKIHEELDIKADENELLKLWGKPGRESVKLLSLLEDAGSKKGILTSQWINHDITKSSATALSMLQDQILYRKTTESKVSQDKSIQVIACPDIYREVESVYNNIIYNLEKDPQLLMTDIAIMVPDMSLYRPVIKYIFDNGKTNLPYSMVDSNAAISSVFAKAVHSLIELIQGNFNRAHVFDFLVNPCFLASQKVTLDDVNIWIEWADKLNVFHNYNKEDKEGLKSNTFTWSQALARLRLGRIMEVPPENHSDFLSYNKMTPYEDLNTGNLNLMETLCLTIESLYAKINKIRNNNFNASQWINSLNDLLSSFLEIPETNPEEIVVKNSLLNNLENLSIMTKLYPDEKHSLDFDFIAEYLKESLINTPGSFGSYLIDGVNISSLVPKRQIPFKITYIMGMEEGIFPGSSDYSSLDIRNLKRKIGDITQADANRYLFLENLVLTQEKFYISYISMDLQKDQEYYPNSIINQLISYMNKFILTDEFNTINIPFNVYSDYYLKFNEKEMNYSDFINHNDHNFDIINYTNYSRLLLYKKHFPENENVNNSINHLKNFKKLVTPEHERKDEEEVVKLRISHIKTYIINPVDSTIRYHLKIYDNHEENKSSPSEEPLFSTFPFDYTFIMESINHYIKTKNIKSLEDYISNYYDYSKNVGAAPEGPFAHIDFNNFKNIIMDRIKTSSEPNISLLEFIESKKDHKYYSKMFIDHIQSEDQSELYFNPPIISLKNELHVELRASADHLWISPDNKTLETLIITTSDKFSYKIIISSFLFYIISKLEDSGTLHDFMKDKNYIINISHGKGVSKLTYNFSTEECKNYLYPLIEEMITIKSFDILPFQIIMENKELKPTDDKASADYETKVKYRNELIYLINRELEKHISSFNQSDIQNILPIEVPENAFEKIFQRYNIFTKHEEEKI